MKKCSVCKEEKELDLFYNSKTSKDGKGYRCKSCDSKARQKYYRENETSIEKRKERSNRHKLSSYGITQDEYDCLLKEQDDRCAICGVHKDNTTMCIDHNHSTGKVRGILCSNCNRGIGLLQDNPYTVRNAWVYLLTTQTH